MPKAVPETLLFKTPAGHEVFAEMDYEQYELRGAKVVNGYTGVILPLDHEIASTLARALKAKQLYEYALRETRAVEETLQRFGDAAMSLGRTHPALEPYWREMAQHQQIADTMQERARFFHTNAMKAIDQIAD